MKIQKKTMGDLALLIESLIRLEITGNLETVKRELRDALIQREDVEKLNRNNVLPEPLKPAEMLGIIENGRYQKKTFEYDFLRTYDGTDRYPPLEFLLEQGQFIRFREVLVGNIGEFPEELIDDLKDLGIFDDSEDQSQWRYLLQFLRRKNDFFRNFRDFDWLGTREQVSVELERWNQECVSSFPTDQDHLRQADMLEPWTMERFFPVFFDHNDKTIRFGSDKGYVDYLRVLDGLLKSIYRSDTSFRTVLKAFYDARREFIAGQHMIMSDRIREELYKVHYNFYRELTVPGKNGFPLVTAYTMTTRNRDALAYLQNLIERGKGTSEVLDGGSSKLSDYQKYFIYEFAALVGFRNRETGVYVQNWYITDEKLDDPEIIELKTFKGTYANPSDVVVHALGMRYFIDFLTIAMDMERVLHLRQEFTRLVREFQDDLARTQALLVGGIEQIPKVPEELRKEEEDCRNRFLTILDFDAPSTHPFSVVDVNKLVGPCLEKLADSPVKNKTVAQKVGLISQGFYVYKVIPNNEPSTPGALVINSTGDKPFIYAGALKQLVRAWISYIDVIENGIAEEAALEEIARLRLPFLNDGSYNGLYVFKLDECYETIQKITETPKNDYYALQSLKDKVGINCILEITTHPYGNPKLAEKVGFWKNGAYIRDIEGFSQYGNKPENLVIRTINRKNKRKPAIPIDKMKRLLSGWLIYIEFLQGRKSFAQAEQEIDSLNLEIINGVFG
jgi:hypothetical protein